MMESFKSIICLGLVVSLAQGCGNKSIESAEEGSTTSGGLVVSISTAWQDDSSNFETQQECTANGTAASPANVTCTVNVPETQLFYSKMKFTITHDTATCSLASFCPYYYQKSNAAGFDPDGTGTAVDCSATPVPDACYGGPAKELVPSFRPVTGGNTCIFSTSSTALEKTASAPNEKTSRQGDRHNRYLSNDYATANRAVANPAVAYEGYVASSMQDYTVSCEDKHGNNLSTITIYVIDSNGTSPTTNNRDSWNP